MTNQPAPDESAEETMASLITRTAARLDALDTEATRGPWTTTEKSNLYGGVVSVDSPDATGPERDGYGGELVGESMSRPNRTFIIAMRGVAGPLAKVLRGEARDWEDSGEVVIDGDPMARLCRAILGEPQGA
jgi:hypothetical protein